MHADTAVETHEVWHRRIVEDLARANLVDAVVRIVIDHLAGRTILDHTVGRRFVILAFLSDLVAPWWGACVLLPGRVRQTRPGAPLYKIRFLFAADNLDKWGAAYVVSVPVGDVIGYRRCGMMGAARCSLIGEKPIPAM